jgi:hypothetical protein
MADVGLRFLIDRAGRERRAAVVDRHTGELALGGDADLLLDAQLAGLLRDGAGIGEEGENERAAAVARHEVADGELARQHLLAQRAPPGVVGRNRRHQRVELGAHRPRHDVAHRRERQDQIDAAYVLDRLRRARDLAERVRREDIVAGGHLDADDGDAQRAEATRHVLEQANVGIVRRQKDEQVFFVLEARGADGSERGDDE